MAAAATEEVMVVATAEEDFTEAAAITAVEVRA
jgi:hypothetical protein